MTDYGLVAFLRARLDEDRAVAEACAAEDGAVWSAGDRHLSESVTAERGGYVACAPYEGVMPWETRRHIADHDPARALAEVEAKRRIVDFLADDAGFDLPATTTQAMSREEWDRVFSARLTLKLLALPHTDHPDYRQEWKP